MATTDTSGAATPEPAFDPALPAAGTLERLTPLVRRRICANGGPFTASGTCSYIVGRGEVAIIDPGPDDADHIAALVAASEGETISAIVVTHTHRDHSPGARRLQALTGAPIVGCGPHRAARELAEGEFPHLDASADREHRPDRELAEGDTVSGEGWTLTALATPGHTMNHLAFALAEENALFSGDHVMAWSTTVVAPPDGSMRAYMSSLDKLRDRPETLFWPGHGGPVRDPRRFVRGLAGHRRQREAAIRARIAAGDGDVGTIVLAVYQGLNPALRGAAALSVFAHLEDMVARGLIRSDGPPRLDGVFEPA
ncbi:MBL fold metallo-hydrolase [Methylobacterium brachythecii]|uniref:Glyoxylase-like metal-dependent hydrolase (Beta-lactamase superfamily II) n=1 Tax=Methylobacterium brachythecii TaxID=1176177 RepID=A0A7W6F7J0_9HYPH|nr:MBL fold metallo-hydrolase [Methylobacterium brachythecii]MBB3903439.1 glyoxylase-like metal-dependent hydrolase (beta-lactamase superfamily II) [Methylobacterium brachythecii]GLS45520.1 MBL fold metallo-hydrolase [Methylobacterium brachythecii]